MIGDSDSFDRGGIGFEVLGPVGIRVEGRPLSLRSAKMRYLVAALLVHGGRPVSAARLAETLWNGDAPASAAKNLHQYIHRLRTLLVGAGHPDRLVRQPAGYLLRSHPGELDLDRFESLVREGRRARDRGDLLFASASLTTALAAWNDEALVDVRSSLVLDDVGQILAEKRISVVEERIAIDLQLGRHGRLVPELAALVGAHPLRERLREYQMLALFASGRTADALAAYQDVRVVLARELGIDPGPGLQTLLAEMLTDGPRVLSGTVPPGAYRELTVVSAARRIESRPVRRHGRRSIVRRRPV